MCIVRFKPATRGDVCPYTLYYSYLNSRQRYGAVVLEQKSPKSIYLIPLPALQKIPSRLPPLSGPGLESSHSDLLLALTFPKKQHSSSTFRKPYECRSSTDRYLQENKCRQKCTENINKEHLSDHSSAKQGAQTSTLPMLPILPFTQLRECQDKPSDLLSGNLLSSEEQSSSTDLANNFAVDLFQSSYGQDQVSHGIENMFGASAFLGEWANDGQNEDFVTNEQDHHGNDAGKESESMTRSKMFNIETNLLDHFKPADILTENFLLSETQLNSALKQEVESKIEGNELTNKQEALGAVSAQYTQDMQTYIKELDKLFTNVPVSAFSQHEDCNHLRSTISCCAEVLNHLLCTSDNSRAAELQIQIDPYGNHCNTTASQESSEHILQSDNPFPLHSAQTPNNFQHFGHSGTMTLEPSVPFPVLLANEVTMEQVEAPFQNGSTSLYPFRFNSSHDQTGIDAELHQPPRQHLFSPYCPILHHHYTDIHVDTHKIQQCSQEFSHAAVIESHNVQ
ncbi:PHD finger protein 3-like [Rhincodon typus]|uniref:PHD finger protein 3-like n=1 Tax=Rhincodon typus TaxID=259920 RepID=UPI00202F4790|nr:PHD finger protein 3-like [Rhincodon typus]